MTLTLISGVSRPPEAALLRNSRNFMLRKKC